MLLRGSTPKPRPSPSLGILGDPSLQPAPSFPSCPLWPLLSCCYLKLFLFQFQLGCGSHYREHWFLSSPPHPPPLWVVTGLHTALGTEGVSDSGVPTVAPWERLLGPDQ